MQDEFAECLVLNTRMAARAVTRRYDRKLRPFGVTAAQFTVMTAMVNRPERSVTEMAHTIAIDRTTLSRNLDLLERKGLVAHHGAEKGNGRLCSLTDKGVALVQTLIPEWRKAQAELREMLTQPDLPSLVAALKHLSRV